MEEISGRSVYLQEVLAVSSLSFGQGQLQTRHEQPTGIRGPPQTDDGTLDSTLP